MSNELETNFLNYVKKIMAYHEAIAVMGWDLRTGAPVKGMEQRSEVIGMLAEESFALSVSKEMETMLEQLETQKESLSPITKAVYEHVKKEFDKNKKIPQNEYAAYVILQNKAESAWPLAKQKGDFKAFLPYLEQLVEANRKFVEYWGYDKHPYDTLLDMYEPGMTVEVLDRVFSQVKEAIVPLIKQISEQPPVDTSFLTEYFSKDGQKQFSLDILKQMGYDFDAGRLDETTHPFATGINPGDVRVTTKYNEHDFTSAVFGTIHEGGHALYEQNISESLVGTPLCTGTSMGIHESQSLFFENLVGRNLHFWKKNYDLFKSYTNGQFDDVSIEEFYQAINQSKPSLIRIESDELTYPLHIIIRYEIEKGLFTGEIEPKDLETVWNEKYEQYLGVKPAHAGEGVLQDIHWAGGSFGYFPSYSLGLMYAAQLKHSMLKDLPNFDELLEEGNIAPIKEWLTTHVHQYGAMKKPLEIIKDATNEELNPQYLIDYLEKKYKTIYQLD